jgi:hypothetical protein
LSIAARLHRAQRRHVFGERHHLRAGNRLHRGVALLVIAVRVAAEQDLDVRELEPELLDRPLNRRHVALVGAVDQNVALRRDDQEHRQAIRPHVIDIANHLVRRERRRHVVGSADVALEQRQLREGVAADGNRRSRFLATAAAACRHSPDRRLTGALGPAGDPEAGDD